MSSNGKFSKCRRENNQCGDCREHHPILWNINCLVHKQLFRYRLFRYISRLIRLVLNCLLLVFLITTCFLTNSCRIPMEFPFTVCCIPRYYVQLEVFLPDSTCSRCDYSPCPGHAWHIDNLTCLAPGYISSPRIFNMVDQGNTICKLSVVQGENSYLRNHVLLYWPPSLKSVSISFDNLVIPTQSFPSCCLPKSLAGQSSVPPRLPRCIDPIPSIPSP